MPSVKTRLRVLLLVLVPMMSMPALGEEPMDDTDDNFEQNVKHTGKKLEGPVQNGQDKKQLEEKKHDR